MRRGLLVAAVVGLACGTAAPVGAETSFGVGVGPTAPIGDFRDSPTSLGFHGDFHALFGASQRGLRLRADAFAGINPYSGADGSTRTLGALFGVQYAIPMRSSPFRPYAIGGLGVFNVHWGLGGRVDSGYSETQLGLAGGVGAAYVFSGFHLFAEARVVVVFTSGSETAFVPVTVGVRFGGR